MQKESETEKTCLFCLIFIIDGISIGGRVPCFPTPWLRLWRSNSFCFLKMSSFLSKFSWHVFCEWSRPLAEICDDVLKFNLLRKIVKYAKINAHLCFCSKKTLQIIFAAVVFNKGMCVKQGRIKEGIEEEGGINLLKGPLHDVVKFVNINYNNGVGHFRKSVRKSANFGLKVLICGFANRFLSSNICGFAVKNPNLPQIRKTTTSLGSFLSNFQQMRFYSWMYRQVWVDVFIKTL